MERYKWMIDGQELELIPLEDGQTADIVCRCRRGWRAAGGDWRLLSIESCPGCADLVIECLPAEPWESDVDGLPVGRIPA